jgi:hypothetical protein
VIDYFFESDEARSKAGLGHVGDPGSNPYGLRKSPNKSRLKISPRERDLELQHARTHPGKAVGLAISFGIAALAWTKYRFHVSFRLAQYKQ